MDVYFQDSLLRSLVEKHGSEDWSQIALEVPRRTATQCRFRWINEILPSILLTESGTSSTLNAKKKAAEIETVIDLEPSQVKKVVLPPFQGHLGLSVQGLPSKHGVGIVQVKTDSPLHGQLDRGDVIVEFMGKSLHGVRVMDFMKMVKDRENESRYFVVHTNGTTSNSYSQEKQGNHEFIILSITCRNSFGML